MFGRVFKSVLLSLMVLAMSAASSGAIAGEAWQGSYAPQVDLSELPPQMRQMMAEKLPRFEFEQDTVKMIIAGKVHSSSPYRMDGLVAVVETDEGTRRVTFREDFSAFTVNGGDGTPYTRQ